jgi:hypothetical protein
VHAIVLPALLPLTVGLLETTLSAVITGNLVDSFQFTHKCRQAN